MKIIIEDTSYEGNALDIVEQMKQDNMNGDEYPDTGTFLASMREMFTRMTDIPCHLSGSLEERARDMLAALASIDAITVLDE